MKTDRFDRLLWGGVLVTAALLGFLLMRGGAQGEMAGGLDRAMEREMAYQARVALLQKLYGPAEELLRSGRPQEALLRLEELARRYPGEAHGHILKGEILREMGALEEAVGAFVQGVRLNGDYIDEGSPLSRRTQVGRLVEEGLSVLGEKARRHPENLSIEVSLRRIYYLQSRLAGGCE